MQEHNLSFQLEAIASGLPLVVSDKGGCRDIVERSGAGLLARSGDVDDFFSKCLELSGKSLHYQELQARGLAFAETKSWASINSVVVDLYKEMVNGAAGSIACCTALSAERFVNNADITS